jgi:hypothetical protein
MTCLFSFARNVLTKGVTENLQTNINRISPRKEGNIKEHESNKESDIPTKRESNWAKCEAATQC